MRTGTGIALLLLIVLIAAFGWKVLGFLVLAILLIPVLLIVAAFAVLVWFRRRARQAAARFQEAIQNAQARRPPPASRPDAIDVEGRDVTDTGESDQPPR
jgi:phosphate/sulfate permease